MSGGTMVDSANNSRYIIPAVDPEKQRLIKQYAMKKSFYGWTAAIPSTIDVTRVYEVLDIAAGTCVWTLDFASIPEVKARLNLPGRDLSQAPIHLYACDIDTKFFPDKSITDELGIMTFQQDVTKPFPLEMHGKFDLLHISFLVICLTESGWEDALKDCHQLLKPGGFLMIDEADPVLYSDVQPPPPETANGHDLTMCMDGNRWLHKANCIYTGFSLENGFKVDLTFHLQDMLSMAGFTVIESRRTLATFGRMCHVYKAASIGDLAEYETFSVENMGFIFDHLAAALLRKGSLEAPKGVKIATDEAMRAMLEEVKEGLRDDGAFALGKYCIARKTGE